MQPHTVEEALISTVALALSFCSPSLFFPLLHLSPSHVLYNYTNLVYYPSASLEFQLPGQRFQYLLLHTA